MSAEEDDFDLDIYGEGDGEGEGDVDPEASMDYKNDAEQEFIVDRTQDEPAVGHSENQPDTNVKPVTSNITSESNPPIAPASMRASMSTDFDARQNPQQGIKRKETSDDRPVDHGATNALMISDLHWWTTEDDIRTWINEADAERDLKEITFNEHKVNGKSKGQVYLEFLSLQSSTAAKHKIESLSGGSHNTRKFSVVFTSASQNPFKTLPKDAPARAKEDRSQRASSTSYNAGSPVQSNYNTNTGFRGGRGGGFNRGAYNNQNSYNRNFVGHTGGYNNAGFANNMGTMNANNYGFNRGGMMGNNMRGNMSGNMRGGRGGMNPMMPMGMGMGMPMGNVPMNPMMAGMGMQGTPFNPAMLNQGQSFNNDWNQHGVKRQRQE